MMTRLLATIVFFLLLPLGTGCQYAHYEYMLEVREPMNPPPAKVTRLPAQLLLTWKNGWIMASFPQPDQVKRIPFTQKLGIWPFDSEPSGFDIDISKEGYQSYTAHYTRQTGVLVLGNGKAFRSDVILLEPLSSHDPSRRLSSMPDVPDMSTTQPDLPTPPPMYVEPKPSTPLASPGSK